MTPKVCGRRFTLLEESTPNWKVKSQKECSFISKYIVILCRWYKQDRKIWNMHSTQAPLCYSMSMSFAECRLPLPGPVFWYDAGGDGGEGLFPERNAREKTRKLWEWSEGCFKFRDETSHSRGKWYTMNWCASQTRQCARAQDRFCPSSSSSSSSCCCCCCCHYRCRYRCCCRCCCGSCGCCCCYSCSDH